MVVIEDKVEKQVFVEAEEVDCKVLVAYNLASQDEMN